MKTNPTCSNCAGRWFGTGFCGGVSGSAASTLTEPVSGRKPVLALLIRVLCEAVFVLSVFGAQAGVIFTSLYSFTGTNDGSHPQAALVQGRDGNFYGTTCMEFGGPPGFGTVFKISTNGALSTLYSFTGNDGADPNGLVQGSDGNFYGTTQLGSTNYYGTVFKISTNGVFTNLYSFTGGNDGGRAQAGLVQGCDGCFYGTTPGGWNDDPNNGGTVFKISTTGALTTLVSFNGTNGSYPTAGLLQGSDGNFYGTTLLGGANNGGTVFKISTNGEFTNLFSFDTVYGTHGANPHTALAQGSDGNFYGTTQWGGTNNSSTVFKISTNGALTTLYSFTGVNDGYFPNALVQGSDGNFYGTTTSDGRSFGGTYGDGYVFKISTNGEFTNLFSFDTDYGTNGANPSAGLVQGSNGSFYGTTFGGGLYSYGTVFRLTIVPEPQLSIIPLGPYVILAWPTNNFVFTLQSTTNLGSSAAWSTNSPAPVVVNGQNTVTNPITGTQTFFRLSQ